MENELTTGQILDALNPLVVDGRLTGKLFVDGILLMDTDADSTVTAPTAYDEYGFSTEESEVGAVRIRAVDEHVADWLENGDEYQKATAIKSAQYYGLMVRGREYTDFQRKQIRSNSQRFWMTGFTLGAFIIYGDRYVHFKTGETKDVLTKAEQYSREWRFNENQYGDAVPNTKAVSWGNAIDPDWPQWEEYATKRIPDEIIKRMVQGADIARRKAEFAANNPNAKLPGR